MRSVLSIAALAVSTLALSACGSGGGNASRDFVRAVGSSTLYPFATVVAESTAKSAGIKSPVIESTGTGAGMKLFCAGVGAAHPDIENASRRMKASEYAECAKNGVDKVIEIQVGLDGIAFAEAQGGPGMTLTPVDVYKALAANPFGKPNTAKTWADVNPALPAIPILVYGPPSTSGTRDALAELILAKGCDTDPAMKALKKSDEGRHKEICNRIREDGAYVEAGENDNLIVQKLGANPDAIGVLGFSFLERNLDTIRDVPIDGVMATYQTISDFSYPASRPLFIYVKAQHVKAIRGLREFLDEYTSERAWGPGGYLQRRGLVPAPDGVRAENRVRAAELTPLTKGDLE